MQINRDGIELIKLFEGYRENAYKCSAGTWTVGYGSTTLEFGEPVQEGDILDRSRAETLLVAYVRRTVEPDMSTLLGNTALTPNQQNAFGSFVYNFGLQKCFGYNLPKYIAAGEDWEKIGRKWLEYVYSDGEKEEGLHRRRLAELMLFYDFPNWKVALSSYWGDEEKLFFAPMREKESASVKEAPPVSIPDKGPAKPRERIVIKDIEEVKPEKPEIKTVSTEAQKPVGEYKNYDPNAPPKSPLQSKQVHGDFLKIMAWLGAAPGIMLAMPDWLGPIKATLIAIASMSPVQMDAMSSIGVLVVGQGLSYYGKLTAKRPIR